MKRMMATLAACFILAIGIALAGCADAKANFTGTWSLESGSDSTLDASSVELMKAVGYDIMLVLNEDGSGAFDLAGQKHNVTWEAKNATEGTLDVENGITGSLSRTGDKLVIESGNGSTMTFSKADGESKQ